MQIRKAGLKDIVGITAIYNYSIINTVATFDLEPKSIEDRMNWFAEHNDKYPVYVAEKDGKVIGWAALTKLYEKQAYEQSVELTVYVDHKYRRQGVGKYLMEELIRHAKKRGDLHSIISKITQSNDASIELHKKIGFECIGTMKEIGFKFGHYIDVHFFQYMI